MLAIDAVWPPASDAAPVAACNLVATVVAQRAAGKVDGSFRAYQEEGDHVFCILRPQAGARCAAAKPVNARARGACHACGVRMR